MACFESGLPRLKVGTAGREGNCGIREAAQERRRQFIVPMEVIFSVTSGPE